MMQFVVIVLLGLGVFFMLVAAIGFVRLPDVFCRLHVTGVLDTLGAPLVLLAIALHVGVWLTAAKILMMIVLLYLTAPLIGHLLARAALEDGFRPLTIDDAQEGNRGRRPETGAPS